MNIAGFLRYFKISGMLYKEFKLLIRRKKAPLLILSLPLLLLVIYSAGSSALNNPQTIINIGVCNNDPQANEFIHSLNGNFNIQYFNKTNCTLQLINEVRKGNILIGLFIDKNFINLLKNGKQATIIYYVDDSKPLTSSMSGYFLERGFNNYMRKYSSSTEKNIKTMALEAKTNLDNVLFMLNSTKNIINSNSALFGITFPLISDYINNSIKKLIYYEKNLSFIEHLSINFLIKPVLFQHSSVYKNINLNSFNFASVFVIISLFTLLLLASNSIIFDKKTNYLLRIKASKTYILTYLFSKLIFYWIISFVQFGVVMLLMLFQGANFHIDLLGLFTSFSIITIINSSLGLLIGSLSNNDNEAILFSLTISLPFLFLSGAFFPIDFMPSYIRFFAEVMPIHNEILLLKEASVLGAGISEFGLILINLGIISSLLLFVTYLILKLRN